MSEGIPTLKAITVHQPWATLIACGAKEYETRGWPSRLKPGSLLACIASKNKEHAEDLDDLAIWLTGLTKEQRARSFEVNSQSVYAHQAIIALRDAGYRNGLALPFGAVVCIARFKADVRTRDLDYGSTLSEKERSFGGFGDLRWGWKLEVVHQFAEPIPARGMQGLWNWTPAEPLPADCS